MATRILVVDDSPTIRKVVTSLLERHGYEAVSAADGHIALALLVESVKLASTGAHRAREGDPKNGSSNAFDIVLLDFVMPKMNGFQFCRALRQNEALRSLPVILMSAKSDKIREQFVLQTGAIDAITKPFDATALVAVIENAIKRSEAWRQRAAALSAGIPEDFESAESTRPPQVFDIDSTRMRIAKDLMTKVASVIAPALAGLPAGAIGDQAKIGTELVARVAPEAVRELALAAQAVDFNVSGKLALSGDLAIIPIGAVLQLLQIENQTGVLTIRDEASEVIIAMRKGLIDLVQSRGVGQEFRLGRYFVEQGLMTSGQIDAVLRDKSGLSSNTPAGGEPSAGFERREDSTSTRRLLGDLLVESGRVTRDQLKEALARQSSELTYEVLRWHKGHFEFRREPPPALAESAQLGLPVSFVVMEGFRRVDEWRLVEAGLGSFDAVIQRDAMAIEAVGTERLARPERVVLDAVDGERTVREIVEVSHMSSFDACKILFQLLEARLVRRRAA